MFPDEEDQEIGDELQALEEANTRSTLEGIQGLPRGLSILQTGLHLTHLGLIRRTPEAHPILEAVGRVVPGHLPFQVDPMIKRALCSTVVNYWPN